MRRYRDPRTQFRDPRDVHAGAFEGQRAADRAARVIYPRLVPVSVPMAAEKREGRGLRLAGALVLCFALGFVARGDDAWGFLGVASAFLAGVLLAGGVLVSDAVRFERVRR